MTDWDFTLPASWYTSLGAVTKFPETNVNYEHELAQIDFIVRRETEDWRSITITKKVNGTTMRSHLTPNGLLFLTLSDETCSFEDFFPGLEESTAHADFTGLPLRRPLTYASQNNWKATVDAYQECLHCAYAHPEFAKTFKPAGYNVINKHNYSQHIATATGADDGLFFFLFPNCSLSLYAGGLTCWRINPSEIPGQARMEFDYYHKAPAGSDEFEKWYGFTRNVAVEDIELCEKTQANLNIGIYSEGLLNPLKENGVIYFHNRIIELCSAQIEEEEATRSAGMSSREHQLPLSKHLISY
ncbi:choline monooxygenase chloroplastic [Fusarium circinatum]|uniref:Choline monooxygenase, chloroplastic n=1 Tax=Fusarium circinatum TaxID=48490 RepID=A0A8H5TV31_FUSCI|nr:choline monooxygenase chloroplastic [Fusarium circinatum]